MTSPTSSFGPLLRRWRNQRRLSQQDLAAEAAISTRHLSCLETQRAAPSREMVLRLSEPLNLPLRERNQLLLAAGFAPHYPQRPLSTPDLSVARQAVSLVLQGHEPYPALAVDRHWHLIEGNRALTRLLAGVDAALLRQPVNVLRLSLHPQGLGPRILNYLEWRTHLLTRLKREIHLTASPELTDLRHELAAYPVPPGSRTYTPTGAGFPVVIPLELHTDFGRLSLFSTTTVFGTPLDVTLAELAIEAFYPADDDTAARLRQLTAT